MSRDDVRSTEVDGSVFWDTPATRLAPGSFAYWTPRKILGFDISIAEVEPHGPPDPDGSIPGSLGFRLAADAAGTQGIVFVCPCGCAGVGSVLFDVIEKLREEDERWTWDGNEADPTLQQRIAKRSDECEWEGLLIAGVWT